MNQEGEIMSFGTRVNDSLGTPISEIGQRVPGSFPVDDIGVHNTESQRSKLHKPNDPRGWNDSGKKHVGHTTTDSGVGLRDPSHFMHQGGSGSAVAGGLYETRLESFYDPRIAATGGQPETDTSHRAAQENPSVSSAGKWNILEEEEPSKVPSYTTSQPSIADDGTHKHGTTGVGNGSSLLALRSPNEENPAAHEQLNLPTTGTGNPENAAAKESNWGDIPRGAGVYNTVTGHGSPEDLEPNRGTKITPVSTSDSAGTDTLDTADVGQRQFMPRPENHRALAAALDNREVEHTDQPQHQERAWAAAGISAGTVGLARYKINHDNEGETTKDKLTQHTETDPKTSTRPIVVTQDGNQRTESDNQEHRNAVEAAEEAPKKRRDSKLASLFHHDRSVEDKDAAEKAKKAKQAEQDAKKAQRDSEKATAHHVKKLEKEARIEAKKSEKEATLAAQAAEEEARVQAEHQKEHEAGEAAAAAAAAEAAATYAAYQAANPSPHNQEQLGTGEEKREPTSPKAEKGGKLRALFHRSKNEKVDERERGQDDNTHTLSKRHGHEHDLAAASAGAYGVSKLGAEHHKRKPSETQPTASTTAEGPGTARGDNGESGQQKEHSRTAAIAATGLGAGGVAGIFAPNDQHGEDKTALSNANADAERKMTEERDYAKPYLAAGAGMGGNQGYDGYRDKNARDSGISAGAGDPYDATGFSCSSEDPKVLAPGTAEGVSAPNAKGYAAAANSSIFDSTGAPRSTENDPSHGGRYNVLPSGTPSGINPDYGKTRDATARSASTSEPHREEDWAKAPAVTAVGAGLGAAASGHYLVGQEDRSEPERKAESEGRRHSQTLGASGPAATATGSKKVVHRCQKCGEENDISSYF